MSHRYPVFEALGRRHEFLDNDAAVAATRDGRIRSIWPYIVRRSREFFRSLKPRERVNFDPEDILVDLWATIAERDHKWEPAKGKYITFAGTIIERRLCEIRDQSRTVESPRNSAGRMKEYIEEEAAGVISSQRLKTMGDILRTGDGPSSLTNESGDIGLSLGDDPCDIAAAGEEDAERLEALVMSIPSLTPYEATVVGRLAGLWGQARQSAFWVAWETQTDVSDVRRAQVSATLKIRDALVAINHPVISRSQ